MDSRQYFAALVKEEIGPELMKRVQDWYQHINLSGHFSRMKKSYNAYYGMGPMGNSSEIIKGGVQGELTLTKVNHFRNLISHMLVMTTSNRPAMDARALNTDYKSQAQTILANGLLDYYLKQKDLEKHFKDSAEISLIFGEGFLGLEWDAQLGDEYQVDPDSGQIQFTGDLRFRTFNPLDVIRDLYSVNSMDEDWKIVRHFKNRFDLAAKYPELADEILDLNAKDDMTLQFNFFQKARLATDLIPVYEFFHRKSDALPAGRYVSFLSDDVVLFDGDLPYREIPVYRISPGNFIGTPHGYTVAFDLLSLQESFDALWSTVLTNQATFGVQSIMMPNGYEISVSNLQGGMNLIQYDKDAGPPQPLQLTKTAPEIFDFMKMMEATMETISGINSVARGNPEASLRSGAALALIQSMAIQFNTGLQQSYAQLIESLGSAIINTLKDFAVAPRIALIVGKNKKSLVKEFTGNDLDKIDRVVVDVGNPLAKTTAGKMEIATNLLQQGVIKTVEDFITVMETGNIDPVLQGKMSENTLIQSENEDLADGKYVQAIAIDAHVLHIEEHKAVLGSVVARQDPKVTQAVLEHITQHTNLLRSTDPGLLQILGQPPLQPQGVPSQPQGGPGQPPPQGAGGPPQDQGPGAPPPMPPGPPPGAPPAGPQGIPMPPPAQGPGAVQSPNNPLANIPNMPSFPKNPLPGGGQWNPTTGGLPQGK